MSEDSSVCHEVGVVAIGRNEGDRLRVCLESIVNKASQIVYVDSGSSDDSLVLAKKMGIAVVELDLTLPFTAARARNAGYKELLQLAPDIAYIQFIDGDCELNSNWIKIASEYLKEHSNVAIVCGRRRERYPHKTIYNLLCDLEWDTPTGETKSCGGDAMMRESAFNEVSGFRETLIAGEEPELCVRLANAGWKIWRLDKEMTMHDADMTRFVQWWNRSMRAGYTYAEGSLSLGRDCNKEHIRALFWGLLIPVVVVLAIGVWGKDGLILLAIYPLQMVRLTLKGKYKLSYNIINGVFFTIGKFPEMFGSLKFYINHLLGIKAKLIEYK